MVDSQIRFLGALPLSEESTDSGKKIVPSAISSRVHGKPGRLVDEDQVVVFKQNAVGRQFEFLVSGRGVIEQFRNIHVGFDCGSCRQCLRRNNHPTLIQVNGPRDDELSRLCFRDRTTQLNREPLRQRFVETLRGVLAGRDKF